LFPIYVKFTICVNSQRLYLLGIVKETKYTGRNDVIYCMAGTLTTLYC